MLQFKAHTDKFSIREIQFRSMSSSRQTVDPFPAQRAGLRFCLICKGQMKLRGPYAKELTLNIGDLVLCSADDISTIFAPQDILTPQDRNPEFTDSKPVEAEVIFGLIPHNDDAHYSALQSLTEPFILSPALKASNPIIDDILRLVVFYALQNTGRAIATLSRLFEILFIEIITGLDIDETNGRDIGQAIEDQKIARAISLIHSDLDCDWTAQILASDVDMSVSQFSKRFKEIVLIEPTIYLSRWRLQRSLRFLDNSDMSIEQIASASGYESETDYSAAFSVIFGYTPNQYRQKSLH